MPRRGNRVEPRATSATPGWRETALARLLGRVTTRLLADPDPMARVFADRGLVPRDHWDLLVPDPPKEAP